MVSFCSKKKGRKEDNNNASGDEDEDTMETQEVCKMILVDINSCISGSAILLTL